MDHTRRFYGKKCKIGKRNLYLTENKLLGKNERQIITVIYVSHMCKRIFRFELNVSSNCILQATHRAGNISDHILTRPKENMVSDFTVHENVLCWHHIIRFKVSIRNPPSARVSITIRKYKSINGDRFSECLHHQFNAAQSEMSASDVFDWFDTSVTNALNEVALVEIRSRQVRMRMPWYNDDVYSAGRVRRRAERKSRKSRSDR